MLLGQKQVLVIKTIIIYIILFSVVLGINSFLDSVNDGGDGNGIGERMEEKINEITQLVKKKKFKKNRKQVLKLLNELSAMAKECEAPSTAPPKPGLPTTPPKTGRKEESDRLLHYRDKSLETYFLYNAYD